jgi:RNA polymerase sigma-70 factor (ECF subfamily)
MVKAAAAAEAAARQSYGRLVAVIAARIGDVASAEDALSQAFAQALEQWPISGVPDNPEGWLVAAARRRGIDAIRRAQTANRSAGHLALMAEEAAMKPDDVFPDERLKLIFACAHPAIERGIRAPLILQTVLGFDAAAIASAFLVSPATMGQRLVRAKARIRHAGIPFKVPEPDELAERLDAVLEAIYAAFSEGWGDATGQGTRRRNLAQEAIWLARLVSGMMPNEPETVSLLALMLFSDARRGARRNAHGAYMPLSEQDTGLWDHDAMAEAEALLRRAGLSPTLGRYQMEAAVQAVHAARRVTGRTDWPAIRRLYAALVASGGSPVARLNLAVALSRTGDGALAMAQVEELETVEGMVRYQPYWAARADIAAGLGQRTEAARCYAQAIGLETDPAVRDFLQRQCDRLG